MKFLILIICSLKCLFVTAQNVQIIPTNNYNEKLLVIQKDTFYMTSGYVSIQAQELASVSKDSLLIKYVLSNRYNDSGILKKVRDTAIYIYSKFIATINSRLETNNFFNIQTKTSYPSHTPYIARINIYTSLQHLKIYLAYNKSEQLKEILSFINRSCYKDLLEFENIKYTPIYGKRKVAK